MLLRLSQLQVHTSQLVLLRRSRSTLPVSPGFSQIHAVQHSVAPTVLRPKMKGCPGFCGGKRLDGHAIFESIQSMEELQRTSHPRKGCSCLTCIGSISRREHQVLRQRDHPGRDVSRLVPTRRLLLRLRDRVHEEHQLSGARCTLYARNGRLSWKRHSCLARCLSMKDLVVCVSPAYSIAAHADYALVGSRSEGRRIAHVDLSFLICEKSWIWFVQLEHRCAIGENSVCHLRR